MYDVCIVGRGPAGLSAGIYAVRAGARTLVFGGADGALSLAKRIDNYFGFPTIGGRELLQAGEDQFTALGGEICADEVTAIEMAPEGFCLHTPQESFVCRAVVLAPGKGRRKAGLPGEDAFLGRGVSHCAICDGFFFKKKRIGVIGCGEYAASEARQLLAFSPDVTVFTEGAQLQAEMPCEVQTEKLSEVFGEAKIGGVRTQSGEEIPLDGLFIARGTAGASELALKLGVPMRGGAITVDADGMTGLPGVFAAGDCLGGLAQVATAVGTGALAGQRAAEFVRKSK